MLDKVLYPCFGVLNFIFECIFNMLNVNTFRALLAITDFFDLIILHRFMDFASTKSFMWQRVMGISISCIMLADMI